MSTSSTPSVSSTSAGAALPTSSPASMMVAQAQIPAASAASASQPAVATLSQANAGVQIVRGGQTMTGRAGEALLIGDKLIVPDGSSAQALFKGPGGQALIADFTPGTEATLAYRTTDEGVGAPVLDVASGHVEVSPADRKSVV